MTSELRDSGQSWLGSIPVHWELRPLGSVLRERKTTVSDTEYPPLSVTMNGVVPQIGNVALTDNNDSRKLVKVGDYVINSRSDRKGAGGLSSLDGSVSVISTVLRPTGIEPRYAHHLLRSNAFQEEFYRWGSGIVADLWSTRYPAMRRIVLPLPPRREQVAIADFLDRETAKIDALIDKQRTLVDRLRERLGAIAELASGGPWELAPLSSCCTLIQTGPFGSQLGSDDYVDDGVPVINPVHLAGGVITPDPATSVPPATADRLARHLLRTGDVVAARRGELGRCAVVPPVLAGALCGTGSVLIRPDSQAYDSDYLQLVLSSRRTSEVLQRGSVGSTMPNLNTSMISRLRLPRPPLDEQLEIVRRVKLKTARILELIGKAEQFIQLALERRSALIGAAVTGQLDVSTGKVA